MNFTGFQLSAMTALAVYASASDGHIDKDELKIISAHLASLTQDVTIAEAVIGEAARLTISYDEAIATVSTMSLEQKKYFCGFIASVIMSDRKITNEELEFWVNITIAADLPRMTLDEAFTFFANELGIKGPNRNSSTSGNTGCCLVIAIPILIVSLIAMSVNYLA